MKTEKEKMLAGELYDPQDPHLSRERLRCRDLCRQYNDTREDQKEQRRHLLSELFGMETDVWVEPPFYCDYGTNIKLGQRVFFNFNCVLLDVAGVIIGNDVFFGPAVQIYAATHPISASERRSGLELGQPITFGSDIWVGGGAIICPGVTIGDRSVIGAGSVVTRDIPPDVVVAGNPARIIRNLHSGGPKHI